MKHGRLSSFPPFFLFLFYLFSFFLNLGSQFRIQRTGTTPLKAGRKSGYIFRTGRVCVCFSLISLGSPHVPRAHMGRTCGEPNESELAAAHGSLYRPIIVPRPPIVVPPHYCTAPFQATGLRTAIIHGTRREPFNSTPMGVNSISLDPPRVRTMGRTCGEPDESKKNTHPKSTTALLCGQAWTRGRSRSLRST